MLLIEVRRNYFKRIGFLCKFSAGLFFAFLLEHSLTSQVTFSRFHFSFLSDLDCSHSEVKRVAKIKLIPTLQGEGPDSRVGSASGQGVGCQWLESRLNKLFLHP